ncbi:VOC family protein [Chitinophaga pendula]|nr:glyoxalase [Chitinophaga sp. MD30]UCJ10315.1 VOC family protein [Chitinophaga pendula]
MILLSLSASSQQKKSPVLNHIALYVVDLQKSTAFYRDVLQIDTIPEPFHDGKHTWFKIGEHSQLHIISGAAAVTAHEKSSHLCFSIPSMDAFIKRLDRYRLDYTNWAGTAKAPTLRVDGVKQIYLQDPDGYWIEINDDKY